MIRLNLTKCEICSKTLSSRGFSYHISKSHSMDLKTYIIKYIYDDNPPVCMCGCGKQVTIRGYNVMEYVDGHCPSGHFKNGVTPNRDYEKWKTNLTNGIRKYNNDAKKNNPDYRSGKNNNFYSKKHTEEMKENNRKITIKQIKDGKHSFLGNNNGRIKGSSLENKFENYLIKSEILYEKGYKIGYETENNYIGYKYYDFFIPIINTVVEIHGSYWHPKHNENLTETQIKNLKNDSFKNRLAKKSHYSILVVYDYELDDFIKSDSLTEIIENYYVRDLTFSGFLKDNDTIHLPEYWTKLVDHDSITVNLTPIGSHQKLFVESVAIDKVTIKNENMFNKTIDCYYTIFAERNDVDKLQVEI